jgi:hypothetical protein
MYESFPHRPGVSLKNLAHRPESVAQVYIFKLGSDSAANVTDDH